MGEFIVWDKKNQKFVDIMPNGYDPSSYYFLDLHGNLMEKDWDDMCSCDNFVAFNYIGKTDETPENNKIYADCSVVEFDLLVELHEAKHLRGVFNWSDEELRYEIDLAEKHEIDGYVCLSYNSITMTNFVIVGTIQQNPELLKEK